MKKLKRCATLLLRAFWASIQHLVVIRQGKPTSGVFLLGSSAVSVGFGEMIYRIFIWSFHFENYFIFLNRIDVTNAPCKKLFLL